MCLMARQTSDLDLYALVIDRWQNNCENKYMRMFKKLLLEVIIVPCKLTTIVIDSQNISIDAECEFS
jgi:hypothetical protein